MGVMSLNLDVSNETWIRNLRKGTRSAAVNQALREYRRVRNVESIKQMGDYTTAELVRIVFTRCMGRTSADNPIGTLSEKDYARLKNAMDTMMLCVAEMDNHEVIE